MKFSKLLSSVLIFLFVISIAGGNLGYADTQTPADSGAPSATAYKVDSMPEIDGNLSDAGWNINTSILKVADATPERPNNNSAKFGVMWDDLYLYVGVEVQDSKVVEGNMFDTDDVEIFIDGNHNKGTSYDAYDMQIGLPYTAAGKQQPVAFGAATITTGRNADNIVRACKKTDIGWNEEVAIPWSMIGIGPSQRRDMGFDVMVTDSDKDGGGYENSLFWSGVTSDGQTPGWNNTSVFGDLTLADGSAPTEIKVTGITLDKSTMELGEGERVKLNPTVSPDNATSKQVNWTSSDASTATVDANGNITAVKAGTAVITATTVDGNFKADCSVTVKAAVPMKNLLLKATVNPITYTLGQNVTFTISITSAAETTLNDIPVTEILPDGLSYVSDDSNGTYNSATGIWTINKLDPGSTANLNIVAKTIKKGQIDNLVDIFVDGLEDPFEDCATIMVANCLPTVQNYSVVTDENKPISGKVLGQDSDNDLLTYLLDSSHSGAKVIVASDGSWTYIPGENYYGDDSFTVKVDDGNGGTAISTITVIINNSNHRKY